MNALAEDVSVGFAQHGEFVDPAGEPPAVPRLTPVNGAQKRKINRLVARAVALEMLACEAGMKPKYELMSIDHIQKRWAVSIGAGLPREAWDDSPSSKPTPLDDVTAIIVDQINLHAPPRQRHLLHAWYKTPVPSKTIAEMLGVSRSGLYLEWNAALGYLRGAFLRSKHRDLIELVMIG